MKEFRESGNDARADANERTIVIVGHAAKTG